MRDVRGVGLGFRAEFARELLERRPSEVAWLEIHPENYLGRAGKAASHLADARAEYALITHGLTQCVGTPDAFDAEYLRALKQLLRDTGATFHSEHLAWGNLGGRFTHDLLPLPFSRAAVRRASESIRELRDRLEIDIAIENVSAYAHLPPTEMSEVEFVLEVLEAADAKMLLDVNNICVNAQNHAFDAAAYIARIPSGRVVQIHVAGHLLRPDGLRVDTHSEPVSSEVFALVTQAIAQVGDVPILLERDGNYPALDVLLDELRQLETMRQRGLAMRAVQS